MSDHENETPTQTRRREFRERSLQKITKVNPVVIFENETGHLEEEHIQEINGAPSAAPQSPKVDEIDSNQNIKDIALGESLGIEEATLISAPSPEVRQSGVWLRKGLFLGDIHDALKKSNQERRAAKGDQLTHITPDEKE